MQEKYKIGDIVRVRSNLKGNTRYYYDGSDNEYLFFNIAMQKFCGHAYKIIDKVSSFFSSRQIKLTFEYPDAVDPEMQFPN